MANIGSLALQITANAQGLLGGLKTAEAAVTSSSAKMAQAIKAGLGGLAGAAGKLQGFLESAYASPLRTLGDATLGMFSAIASKIPLVGGLLALPFEGAKAAFDGFLDAYDTGAARIMELGRLAERTGSDFESLQVMKYMLGDMQAGSTAMFKFQQNLGTAASAAAGTRDAFTRLGLSGQELAKMMPLDAMDVVFDKLKTLDVNARSLAVRQLFGRQGLAIMPAVMKEGAEGLEQVRKRLVAYGAAVTPAAYQSVKAAQLAKKHLALLKEGFTNQVTLAVAPIVAALSSDLGGITDISGMAEHLLEAFENASVAVATFVDSFGDLQTTWKILETGWDYLVGAIIEGIGRIVKELPTIEQAVTRSGVLKVLLGPAVAGGLIGGERLGGAGTLGEDLVARGQAAREAAVKAYQGLRNDLAAQGLTAWQEQVQGVFAKAWDFFREQGKAAADDVYKGLLPLVEKLQQSLEGPLDHWRNSAEDLKRLAALPAFQPGNLIDKDKGLLERDAFAMFDKLRGAAGGLMETRFAGAMTSDSKEAYSTIMANAYKPTENIQEEIKGILEALDKKQEEEIRIGKEVLDVLKAGGLPVKGL